MATVIVKKRGPKLPTATVVKKADRKVPGTPSAARVKHVRERLAGSPFARSA